MKVFTKEQIDRAVYLLSQHHAHCNEHYYETLDEIGEHGVLTSEEVEELVDHPEVAAKVKY